MVVEHVVGVVLGLDLGESPVDVIAIGLAHVRAATGRARVGRPIASVVDDLNVILRSWGNYFRYGNSARKFAQIDRYVHERLAFFMSRKHGRPGRNWQRRYKWTWFKRLGVQRLSGTVRYGTANAWR